MTRFPFRRLRDFYERRAVSYDLWPITTLQHLRLNKLNKSRPVIRFYISICVFLLLTAIWFIYLFILFLRIDILDFFIQKNCNLEEKKRKEKKMNFQVTGSVGKGNLEEDGGRNSWNRPKRAWGLDHDGPGSRMRIRVIPP